MKKENNFLVEGYVNFNDYYDSFERKGDYYIVKKDSFYGVLDKDFNEIIPTKYIEIILKENDIFKCFYNTIKYINDNRKTYQLNLEYRDKKGNILEKFVPKDKNCVADDLYYTIVNNKGYLINSDDKMMTDKNGNILIINKIDKYSDEYTYFEGNNISGFINSDNRILLCPENTKVIPQKCKYPYIVTKNNDGYIDIYLNDFDNIMIKSSYEDVKIVNNDLIGFKKNGKWGIYNVNVGLISSFEYDNAIILQKMVAVHKNNKYGLINHNGEDVTNFIYDDIIDEHEGKIVVKNEKESYFIDNENARPLEIGLYKNANAFCEDLASVKDEHYYKYIDKDGNNVISGKYLYAGDFKNGYAVVYTPFAKAKLIDKNGNEPVIKREILVKNGKKRPKSFHDGTIKKIITRYSDNNTSVIVKNNDALSFALDNEIIESILKDKPINEIIESILKDESIIEDKGYSRIRK